MHRILQSSSKLCEYNSMLRDKCIKQDEDFDQERNVWDRDRKKWSKKLGGVVAENQNLQFENASKAISLAESEAKYDIKLEEIKSLRNEMELLKASKSEDISGSIIGGDDKKNISKSINISTVSDSNKNISKYFIRKKNMDQAGKIDGNISDHTRHDGITEPSKVDTEISSKINEETNINEISKDILLAQPENNTPSLIRSHPQISMGGVEAIPVMVSTLMSPLSAYMLLALLIIAVMWFVVLRRTWGLKRKSEQLQDVCKGPSSPLYTDCIVTHSFMVVGMRFRGGHKFKKSDTITLEPEPSNTYDKNAIKVMVYGIHKAYVAKDENVSIGDLMKKYPNYRITAHGKKNYNKSASLNLEYPWMVCERCRDTLQASRDYDYSYW
ncbi:8611_t:CDS:2 [Entrophospora sp. SA101]|nr:8611_t:CDS:2 [Entrophospora sp. SA101]